MIGFLGIDTDAQGIDTKKITARDGNSINLTEAEIIRISVDTPMDIFNRNSPQGLFSWIPTKNDTSLSALSIGAGQIRSNGRFAITCNEISVTQRIQSKLDQINNATIINNDNYSLLGVDTEVHVVFSLGGGTGCGTFLNLAYLLNRLMGHNSTAKISGYAILSDVFCSMMTGAMSARVRPNAMGALLDIDYLTHLVPSSDPVEIKWFRTTDRVNFRPYQALYLIDNKNADNDTFDNVDELCQMISLALVTSIGELGVAMASVSDNVAKQISEGTMDISGKKAWVASMGVSEITFSADKLASIYTQKARVQIINKMLNAGASDPSAIANNWIDTENIRENHQKDDVINYFLSPEPKHNFQEIDNPNNALPECTKYLSSIAMEKQEVLDQKLSILQTRVSESLTNLITEQSSYQGGIYTCENILQAILVQVDQCDKEMIEEIEEKQDILLRMESSLDTACIELGDCMKTFFKRGKDGYTEEVLNKTHSVANTKREIQRRQMAHQFYNWLHTRVQQSVDRINIIKTNLDAIKRQSISREQKMLLNLGSHNFFQYDVSVNYSSKVTCLPDDIVFNDFSKFMVSRGGIITFRDYSSEDTAKVIEDFVKTLPKYQQLKSMTVDDALKNLPDNELNKIIERAIRKSAPLLPYTYRGFDAQVISQPVDSYYIGVANKNNSAITESRIREIAPNIQNVDLSEIGLKDKIIIYRQFGVVPAFTLKTIDNYRNEYERMEAGREGTSHWDAAMYQRMKRERFDLMPKSEVSEQAILKLWTDSIIFGLLKFDPNKGQYRIKSRDLGGNALEGWLVNMGATRIDAFNFFQDNIDILESEIKSDISRMDIPGPDNKILKCKERCAEALNNSTYLQNISQCPHDLSQLSYYPDDFQLLNKEINYLTDRL